MDIQKTLKAADDGIWVTWRDGVEIKLRMSPEAVRRIRKQCLRKVVVDGVTREELDQEKMDGLLSEYAILEWRGLHDGGNPFPCTPENIKLLLDKSPSFSTFVNQTVTELERVKENELKNS